MWCCSCKHERSHNIQVHEYTVVVANDVEVQLHVKSYDCHFPGTSRDQMDRDGVSRATAKLEMRLQQVYVSYQSEIRSHCRLRGDTYLFHWSRCRSIIKLHFTRRNMMVSNQQTDNLLPYDSPFRPRLLCAVHLITRSDIRYVFNVLRYNILMIGDCMKQLPRDDS